MEDLLRKSALRMEWAAEYIGEAGGRGRVADRVQELREYAAQLREYAEPQPEESEPEDDADEG